MKKLPDKLIIDVQNVDNYEKVFEILKKHEYKLVNLFKEGEALRIGTGKEIYSQTIAYYKNNDTFTAYTFTTCDDFILEYGETADYDTTGLLMPKTDEYYVVGYSDGSEYLLLSNNVNRKQMYSCKVIDLKLMFYCSFIFTEYTSIRLALPDEIAWLDACIAANKFVDKPKVDEIKEGDIVFYANAICKYLPGVEQSVLGRSCLFRRNYRFTDSTKPIKATPLQAAWYNECIKPIKATPLQAEWYNECIKQDKFIPLEVFEASQKVVDVPVKQEIEFKVGDTVECIKDSNYSFLKKGDIYIVSEVISSYIQVLGGGNNNYYKKHRFKHKETTMINQVNGEPEHIIEYVHPVNPINYRMGFIRIDTKQEKPSLLDIISPIKKQEVKQVIFNLTSINNLKK